MYWANFIHLYQPPTREEWIVRKVADKMPENEIRRQITGQARETIRRYQGEHPDVAGELTFGGGK